MINEKIGCRSLLQYHLFYGVEYIDRVSKIRRGDDPCRRGESLDSNLSRFLRTSVSFGLPACSLILATGMACI
jgi:hypothetical protein